MRDLIHTTLLLASCLASIPAIAAGAEPPLMVVGIDTKFGFDDAGHRVFKPNAGDLVQFYDLTDPSHPALVGSLPLINSVVGPPTNLAITPNGHLALIANSIVTAPDDKGVWKPAPDNKVYVVDTASRPPRLIDTLTVGAQPSGIAISPDGTIALVANRAGKSISVLSLGDGRVEVTQTVPMGDVVSSVAFTPDGKRALASKFALHRVAVLAVEGGTVRPTGREMLVGQFPYTVTVTADGRYALAGSDAEEATSHGDINPVAVMDLTAEPPRTVDFLPVGDGVEGVAASPRGDFAVASILQGSLDAPRGAWYRHATGKVTLLSTSGPAIQRGASVDVGAFPEGVAFSPDGRYVYCGNFGSNSISVLHLVDGTLIDTHADIALPGPPAALRVGSQ